MTTKKHTVGSADTEPDPYDAIVRGTGLSMYYGRRAIIDRGSDMALGAKLEQAGLPVTPETLAELRSRLGPRWPFATGDERVNPPRKLAPKIDPTTGRNTAGFKATFNAASPVIIHLPYVGSGWPDDGIPTYGISKGTASCRSDEHLSLFANAIERRLTRSGRPAPSRFTNRLSPYALNPYNHEAPMNIGVRTAEEAAARERMWFDPYVSALTELALSVAAVHSGSCLIVDLRSAGYSISASTDFKGLCPPIVHDGEFFFDTLSGIGFPTFQEMGLDLGDGRLVTGATVRLTPWSSDMAVFGLLLHVSTANYYTLRPPRADDIVELINHTVDHLLPAFAKRLPPYDSLSPVERQLKAIRAKQRSLAARNGEKVSIAYNLGGVRPVKPQIDPTTGLNTGGFQLERNPASPVVLHVPHAGLWWPSCSPLPDTHDLARELVTMADLRLDEIADMIAVLMGATTPSRLISLVSRVAMDPERFDDDTEEMNTVGMGVVYEKTHDGRRLYSHGLADEVIADRKTMWYRPYTSALAVLVDETVDRHGRCAIVDLHSYAVRPLPYERHRRMQRPPICVGYEQYHDPGVQAIEQILQHHGYETARNKPFAGSYVPLNRRHTDPRITSVMLEVRKDQYLDQTSDGIHIDEAKARRLVDALIDVIDQVGNGGRHRG